MGNSITSKISTALNLVMLWLLFLTAFLLFLPLENISSELSLKVEANRTLLYAALIVEISLFLSRIIIACVSTIFRKRRAKKTENYLQDTVASFDFAEKALLREYVLQRRSVLDLPVNEPTVASLTESGILEAISFDENNASRARFMIAKQARPYITYRAIGLSRSKMSDEQIAQIIESRPRFARKEPSFKRSYRGSGAIKSLIHEAA